MIQATPDVSRHGYAELVPPEEGESRGRPPLDNRAGVEKQNTDEADVNNRLQQQL